MDNEIAAAFRQLEAMPLCTAVHLRQHFPRRGLFLVTYYTHHPPIQGGPFHGHRGSIYTYRDYNQDPVPIPTLVEGEIWLWVIEKMVSVQGWTADYVCAGGWNISPAEYEADWQAREATAIPCPHCGNPRLDVLSSQAMTVRCQRCYHSVRFADLPHHEQANG
jgi:DNA-directed RNA polymerase subunit RPC12/RpoP